MPPKRVMGMFSDYAPQMKQRRTFDTYPESTPENMQNTPSLAPSTIDSWYNAPSSYKPEAYDSGYYDSGNRSYADGGTYNESVGAYGNRAGGYGSGSGEYNDGIGSYGNGVGSYGTGTTEIPSYPRDSNYQAPYGKKGVQKKRVGNALPEETFIDDMALVSEAEKHFRQTRGTSFLNTLKSAMDIVQSMEKAGPGRPFLGLDEWDDGGWGYDQGWGGSRGGRGQFGGMGRGMGRGSRGVGGRGAQGGGRGLRGAGRGGQAGGRGFGRGVQGAFQGAGQRGRGAARGQGQLQGRGQARGGKLGFQNQTFQNLSRRGGHMAPVHSLATVQAKTADFNLSLPEKIRRFCLFCINEGDKVNEIQTIENALTASKLGLKSEFTVNDVNGKMFSGALFLDGVFIARCANKKKKQTKHDVYAKALSVLRTQTVSQIMALKDEGPESVLPDQSNAEMDALMETIETDVGDCPQGSCMPNSAVPGLHKLTKYLKQRQATNNCIQSHVQELEQAFTASHSELSHKYDVDMVQVNGKSMFRGRLYIEGILFAGALEAQKKKAKQKVSEQAMDFLLKQTIGNLVRGKSLKDLDIDESVFDPPTVSGQATEKELLEKFITNLKANNDVKNRVTVLIKFASKLGIPVSTIFRRLGEKTKLLECKLFVSGLLLGTGMGETFPATRHDAYNKAFELCNESSADEIMENCRRINKTDTDDPNKVEPTTKTKKKMEDSNLMRLKRIANFDLDERLKVNTSEMVIMEHSEWAADRKRNAFCILSESALQNRMLLEWNLKKNEKLFSCTMSLQKMVLADVSALSKASARSLAAAAVLFRLYETLPVVMSVSKNLPNVWILYEDIRKSAQELKQQCGEIGSIDDDMVKLELESFSESGKTGENASENATESAPERKHQSLQYNKWVVKYVEQLIKEYADKETVDEIIFGSGLPVGDQKRISALTREHGLKFVHRTYQGQTYSSINKRLGPLEICHLLQNGVTSKRYSLVPAGELPSYQDIEEDIINAGKIPEPPMQ